ncbi:MAG: NTP transferase domain-containing protein [Elusimicrobiota bacterium]
MTAPLARAGIIAAGLGSRLSAAHPDTPKPLVPVRGKPLVYWVVANLRSAGIRHITILLNTSGDAVRTYLEENFADLHWRFLRRDTASSWESFRLVSRTLAQDSGDFMISTVDALIRPADIARFSGEALAPATGGAPSPAAALALTGFVEDEKPLWAQRDAAGNICALGEDVSPEQRLSVTCGLYALTRALPEAMPAAAAHGKLRSYWTDLIRSGAVVRGVLLQDTIDVDRPEDLSAAEKVISCYGA